jgi:hypothetical protein
MRFQVQFHAAGAARLLVILAAVAVGTASGPIARATGTPAVRNTGFHQSLATCRFWKGGAHRRSRVAATDPYISACLKRRGWTPDGLPNDLLGDQSSLGDRPLAIAPEQRP